jgi:AmmeMemoRadiSam system protein B
MVPHAGWIYSGRVAAATLARARIPSRVLLIGPRHRPTGADWAVAPHKLWALPGRNLESDPALAEELAAAVTDLALDAEAHRPEWSLEVQLPILARLAPQTKAVGILLRGGDLPRLHRFADELAAVLSGMPERPLLVASTDMNHEANDEHTRKVDRLALDAIEALDPERLYKTVFENRISMCGVLPVVLVMETLRRLGSLTRCEPVAYATSADVTGDRRRVVGYAGMLFA